MWIQLVVYDYEDPHTDRYMAMLGRRNLVSKLRWELKRTGRELMILMPKRFGRKRRGRRNKARGTKR